MISNKMAEALNDQIKAEFDSAYLYLSMSVYLEAQNLKGMAHWVRVQAREEAEHADKLMRHLYDRGARVVLDAVAKPASEFGAPADVFKAVLQHERYVSERFHKLMTLAREEKDYASESMLKWFIDEQVEEEAGVEDVARKFEFVGSSAASVYLLDKELAQR
jgi:ferritin